MISDVSFKKTTTMLDMPANMYIFMSEVKQLNMQIYGAWLTVVSTTPVFALTGLIYEPRRWLIFFLK